MSYETIRRKYKPEKESLLFNIEEPKDNIIILSAECPICLEPITNDQNYMKFEICYHYYHIKCMNDWRKQNKINSLIYTCELCQIPRDIIEFKEIIPTKKNQNENNHNENNHNNIIKKICNKVKNIFM